MKNRRGFLLTCVTGFVAMAFVGTVIADGWRRKRGSPNAGDFEMLAYHGISGLALHHFSRGEIVRELKLAGFRQIRVEPVSLRPDCRLPLSWLVPGLRAYGFLVSSVRPTP